MQPHSDDEPGVIVEFWVECPECGCRANVLDRLPDCDCQSRFWITLPALTKRLRLGGDDDPPNGHNGRSRLMANSMNDAG